VLFNGGVRSGCGLADAGMGPFYCPLDRQVYIDLSFYRELKQRFGAPGDFAQAYVIAHEVGHHVQHVLGLMRPLEEARA
jgi:predicted metalloprotease